MNEQLFDYLIYTVAACHAISLVYLFYANYVRVRYPQLCKTATTAATIVAIPWLVYAVFFIALQLSCSGSGDSFVPSVVCILGVLWIFYVALGVFSVAFLSATWLCWTLFRALHGRSLARPAH
jgi:hypothetical protein